MSGHPPPEAIRSGFELQCSMVPRGLEPRTLRLLAVRSNQLSYETCETRPEGGNFLKGCLSWKHHQLCRQIYVFATQIEGCIKGAQPPAWGWGRAVWRRGVGPGGVAGGGSWGTQVATARRGSPRPKLQAPMASGADEEESNSCMSPCPVSWSHVRAPARLTPSTSPTHPCSTFFSENLVHDEY